MKSSFEMMVLTLVVFIAIALLALTQMDFLNAIEKQAQVRFVATQYISAERLQRSGESAHYSDKYIARFELEGRMYNMTVDPNSYRKINKMKPEKGPMDFTVVYKKGFFSKEPVSARINLNSNEQFRNMD